MPFNKYYRDELAYLREMGREFSQAYPALAPMLSERGGDPDVERLLEGFAFLTGRIREKLDDELPELMLTVSQLLFPQLVRPLPATSILQFEPVPGGLRESRIVPAGTEVQSIPVDGTPCRFRTSADCVVSPWTLESVAMKDVAGAGQELHLELALRQSGDLQRIIPESLRLFLTGDSGEGLALLSHIKQQTFEVLLYDLARGRDAGSVRLGPECLREVGFVEHEALLPQVKSAFPGFRLLQEYYLQPSKFSFVELDGMRRVASLGEVARVGIVFRFTQRQREVRRIGPENFKLHCTPIVNVFETTAEPIRLDSKRERHVVRPSGLANGHGSVYSIRAVHTVLRGGKRVEIPSFLSFDHASQMEDRGRLFYSEHLRSTVVGSGADTYLSVGTAEDSGVNVNADVLSVDLLATNGPLANALRIGEITEATSTSPPFARFRNLQAVTPYVPPPLGHDLQWRATAHTAMNLRALTEVSVLQTTLAVYNLQALVDRQIARANELRIEALKSIKVTPGEKLYRGAVVRGVNIDIALDESGFSGDGDLYLFGAILDRLFGEYVSINSFSRTRVSGIGSNVEFKWPARSGNQTLI